MKTYNTVEDILNDHELMDKEHFKISVEILRILLEYSIEFRNTYKSIKGSNIWEKTEWLKSEYERRQNKRYVRAVITPPETKVTVEFMEKKPNLIPFDLEKAKAGAKVIHYKHPAKIIYETEKYIFLAVLPKNGEYYCATVEKGEYYGMFIESEPLPEMWMPVFKSNTSIENYHSGAIFNTKKDADEFGKKFEKYIGTAKLVFE